MGDFDTHVIQIQSNRNVHSDPNASKSPPKINFTHRPRPVVRTASTVSTSPNYRPLKPPKQQRLPKPSGGTIDWGGAASVNPTRRTPTMWHDHDKPRPVWGVAQEPWTAQSKSRLVKPVPIDERLSEFGENLYATLNAYKPRGAPHTHVTKRYLKRSEMLRCQSEMPLGGNLQRAGRMSEERQHILSLLEQQLSGAG